MSQGRLLGGRYQVGELLGYGGMAEVHRGRDLRLGRDVAIKTLRTDLARDATFQMRFRREAQNAAALNHPAIVAVYDTGEEHGQHGEELPHIIMEYVNGRTLKEILSGEGRLLPRRALELTADICSALEFSHRHGIIHRDIKPGNVMLTQTGQVKVMDFGIARALASGATTMTQTSAVIGTAQYLSPEQARGEPVDARSDVYATGCVLFELLCGHPPFVGDNPVSVAYQHVREEAKPPSTSNRDVTPDIDAVVLKALAKNPLNRYQSAGEMRGDLMRAVAGRPVAAPPVLTEDQMTAMITPQSTGRTARQSSLQARESTRAAQRSKRRGSPAVVIALSMLGVLAVVALGLGLYLETRKIVEVPNIIGLTQQEADATLSNKKLTGETRENIKTTDCPIGQIMAQAPDEGTELREGGKVSYDVCTGPDKTQVPQMVGLSQNDADKALKDAHLIGDFRQTNSAKESGEVLSSDPPAGQEVDEGTTVIVQVSKGNQKIIPDVSGQTANGAENTLRNAGFSNIVKVTRPVTDSSEVGRVVGQDPSPDKAVPSTQKITIYIGKSNQPSPSPSPSPSPPEEP
ncbi:MAG: Stk1 family PASTA domain-containing Ser/Thr kinase [Dactylosporangium sp.]|nr:Stk1 family PASTA domain-containing Ser/Thr kinase [Dactylosporangium sp.]NNJ61568.1 Stk1 family PASTA domain-containing Ser/Thr kinase [Dactylosporangium sp.]